MFVFRQTGFHTVRIELNACEIDNPTIFSFFEVFSKTEIRCDCAEEFRVWIIDYQEVIQIMNKIPAEYPLQNPM
jgi:hypothetical protein